MVPDFLFFIPVPEVREQIASRRDTGHNLSEIQTEGPQDCHTWDGIGSPKSDMGYGNGQPRILKVPGLISLRLKLRHQKIRVVQEKIFF